MMPRELSDAERAAMDRVCAANAGRGISEADSAMAVGIEQGWLAARDYYGHDFALDGGGTREVEELPGDGQRPGDAIKELCKVIVALRGPLFRVGPGAAEAKLKARDESDVLLVKHGWMGPAVMRVQDTEREYEPARINTGRQDAESAAWEQWHPASLPDKRDVHGHGFDAGVEWAEREHDPSPIARNGEPCDCMTPGDWHRVPEGEDVVSVQTPVSDWRTLDAIVTCDRCYRQSLMATASEALRIAREHAAQTGHTVNIEERRTRRVTRSYSHDFETLGVGATNPQVCRVWDARDPGGVR
jgi:hypothetical protein